MRLEKSKGKNSQNLSIKGVKKTSKEKRALKKFTTEARS